MFKLRPSSLSEDDRLMETLPFYFSEFTWLTTRSAQKHFDAIFPDFEFTGARPPDARASF
jgi:hypothetical protein